MTATDWGVLTLGVATIVWIFRYFFGARPAAVAATATAGGVQEVNITVRGGYTPGAVTVRAGTPVRLLFDRQETSGCSEEVVFPDFGVRKFLPAHQQTAVQFTPSTPGSYGFTCGMGMLRGTLTVLPAEG